jgi:hypothetical protein
MRITDYECIQVFTLGLAVECWDGEVMEERKTTAKCVCTGAIKEVHFTWHAGER